MRRVKKGFWRYEVLSLNFGPIILFELVYKAFGTYCFFPFLVFMVRRVLLLENRDIIAFDTIKHAFATPYNVVILGTLGVLGAYYFLLEISVLMEGFRFAGNGWKAGTATLFGVGFKKSLDYFYPRNWLAFIVVLFFFPFLRFGLKSGIANGLYMINLTELYSGVAVTRALVLATFIGMLALSCAFCYAFVFFTVRKWSFPRACWESLEFYSGDFSEKVSGILKVLLVTFLVGLAGFALLCLGMLVVYVLLFVGGQSGMVTSTEVYRRFVELTAPMVALFFLYLSVTSTTVFFGGVYGLVFDFMEIEAGIRRRARPSLRPLTAVMIVLIVLGYSFYQGTAINQNITDDSLVIAQTGGLLTGHRGNIKEEIQNTAASFESAIRNGAEYIELDVRKSADGVLVVIHDAYVLNKDGEKLNISETPYSQLNSVYLPGNVDDGAVDLMTLDQAIDLCGDRVRMNIELKTIPNADGFVQAVVDTVKAHGIQETCFLASSNYGYVVAIEDMDSEINTLFLTDSNYGDIENLAADGLSLAFNAIDQKTVDRIHLKGKCVHAWILESENDFQVMIGMGVDYLITNDVRMAQAALANNRPTHSQTLQDILGHIIVQS